MTSAAPTVEVGKTTYHEPTGFSKTMSWVKHFARKRTFGFIAGLFCVFIVLVAIGAATGLLTPYDPTAVHGADRLLPIGSYSIDGTRLYLLGTDEFGRDVFDPVIADGFSAARPPRPMSPRFRCHVACPCRTTSARPIGRTTCAGRW